MKTNLRSFLVPLALVLSGCVFPYPNTQTAVPSIHGRIINAKTGSPVEYAGVVVNGHKETAVMTHADGTFATDPITSSSFFKVWNPFAAKERTTVQVRVLRPGFEKVKQNVDWLAKTQPDVHLAQPISLKPLSKEELLGDTTR